MKVAIVGCGDIGIRTARLLIDAGHSVVGIRRNVAMLPDWLESVSADVSKRQSLDFLSADSFDAVIYCLAAAGFNESAYRNAYVTGVSNTLDALGSQLKIELKMLKRFIFVSSTSVYHQNDGSVVDEASPTRPTGFNGQIVLEGEKLVRDFATGTVVRFSGIYGPHRTRMIERVKKGIQSNPQDSSYTNRIHADDCAGVLAHLVELASRESAESLYLASDSVPCSRVELEVFLAGELGIAEVVPGAEGISTESPTPATKGSAKRIAGSKRCSNTRLLHSGYRFLYPDYRSGYKQVLQSGS